MTTITDASFCNDSEIVHGEKEDNRSQQGYIVVIAPHDILHAQSAIVHPICWSSTTIKRVCRSTFMAETFAMSRGTEQGARVRAAVVDAQGKLNMHDWEATAAAAMPHCWITDCDSLYEHLVAPKLAQIDNKRLAIDLMAMRQFVWERNGDRTEIIDTSCGDYPRWIDTSTMITDPLTKVMKADRLITTMTTGVFDMTPTPESLAIKSRNRELRRTARQKSQEND